jgi:acetylornithine/N-succinyldiaminopimelate aminotransferase
MSAKNDDLQARARKVLLGNYRQAPLAMVRGRGLEVWDADGRRYLDMFGGIATCALGHCHPAAVAALREQSERLWHITNGYYIEPQIELAERLTRVSGLERAFFCNSGGEANEAALKLARRYFKEVAGQPERFELICFTNSFHGRTLATTAATGQAKYQKGYEPLPEGFVHVPFGDLEAVERAIGPRTAGIWAEPIQGEGGVCVPPPEFLRGLRELCDRHGLLLLLDEVQTGMGRTGRWFGHQHAGIRPDVMTLAKAIANGLPLAAMLCTEKAASALGPGSHGSTFGGNPLATAVGVAVFDTLEREHLIERCAEWGERFRAALRAALIPGGQGEVVDVRGQGLLIGVELRRLQATQVVAEARQGGVLFNAGAEKVIRIAPAFLIDVGQVTEAVAGLKKAIETTAQRIDLAESHP